jgi:glycosyltransferase involved in cell wall biosynthesis
MRVLCLTFGDATTASTFYRVHQYKVPLADRDIHLEAVPARQFCDWNSIQTFDAVLVQKSLLSVSRVRQLRRAARRLLYDVDDAIWHPQGKPHFLFTRIRQSLRLRAIAQAADQCLAANGVLAAHLKRFTPRVAVLPMALDGAIWKPRHSPAPGQLLRIGWSGHPVNLRYLESIESALLQVQREFQGLEFAIFSGQPPRFRELEFVHLPFAPGKEPEIIQSFDIGLLPLPDDMFSAGKSPIKGLQYLACGTGVVLSPADGAKEMFAHGLTGLFAANVEEWSKQLRLLIEQPQMRAAMGAKARGSFEDKFTLDKTAPQFAALLKG